MAIKLKFDDAHNAIDPTIVLTTRTGRRLGQIPAYDISYKDCLNDSSEMVFRVNKSDCADRPNDFWNKIVDFKLAWIREWDEYFELDVEVDEQDDTTKIVSATSLAESELSQIKIYGMEVNTEDDILRDDYRPTILYSTDKEISLLDRILEKAPHYSVAHVDSGIANIQRSFSFDSTTIHDALKDVSEELNCLIKMQARTNANGRIDRTISVYDLESRCLDCGERGDFIDVCPKCGSTNIQHGYGNDTAIYVSTDNLADGVKLSIDNGSVKNCFKLEAGDDLMTATIIGCNPNGSPYIWNITDAVKADMSDALVAKLDAYDALYKYYQNEYTVNIPQNYVTGYNNLVRKYVNYKPDAKLIDDSLTGYSSLMLLNYEAIDFYYFLQDELMPAVPIVQTNASTEAAKLKTSTLSPVAVKKLSTLSKASADSAVQGMAKTIIDNRYSVSVNDSAYSNGSWSGTFTVTNYSNDEDTATTSRISISITDNYEEYTKQCIERALSKNITDGNASSIIELFKLDNTAFANRMKNYSLSRLTAFHDSCQACIDIMIQMGVSDDGRWEDEDNDLYQALYLPYYTKLLIIEQEMQVRTGEIEIISGKTDPNTGITTPGLQTFIVDTRSDIQDELNFEKYLGHELWLEFTIYRREDEFKNDNYISDGLNNAELLQNALQFIEVANKEILKSSTMQHTISASLKDLLHIRGFEKILDQFELGNWIRLRVDDQLFRLRLIQYETSQDSLSVDFSDVTQYGDLTTDVASIIGQASSIATSYDYVARQAKKGNESNSVLNDWVDRGLTLTKMKIIDSADNQNITWDEHGILCREYMQITGDYDDRQLRVINRGLYLTDDAWKTSRAGIGDFIFYNPKTRQYEEAYGVIADTIVGNLILSKEVGIYNEAGSITLDENGFTLTSDKTDDSNETPVFVIQKQMMSDGEVITKKLVNLDSDGNFTLDGTSVNIISSNSPIERTLDDLETSIQGYAESMIRSSNAEVLLSVENNYSTKQELAEVETATRTQLDLLSNGLTIRIDETREELSAENDVLRNDISEINTYFRFTADGQYIGKEGSDSILHLYNDVMEILVSGEAVTTVDRGGLYATEASISSLHMGEYLWTYDPNTRHLTLT